ncbi:hypothetical protein [Methylobacterium brachiatum]|uniref:hypothetical protein n=1 Tax=Methylobacterium brachiatum TaxID=269660 RepID=UPI0024483272|nr:hypothetical protein [Methylobacterium brachiatum]MDH2310369.1 hypothetical protein [Methylobacterium brachiatum]
MGHAQYHAVQPFVRAVSGGISTAAIKQCSSPEAAKRLAERLVSEKKAIGALAYSRPGASSADEFAAPTFLARIGEVPETDDY